MNVVRPEIERIISWSAWRVHCRCQSLEVADVKQELWIEAIISAKSWEPDKHAALSTYLFPKIRWRAMRLLRDHARRMQRENHHNRELIATSSAPRTKSMSTLIRQVRGCLRPKKGGKFKSMTLKVFDTITDPPPELFSVVKEFASKDKVDLAGEDVVGPIMDFHVAHFLGVSTRTIWRSMIQIRKVLESEVHGGQEKGQRKHASS